MHPGPALRRCWTLALLLSAPMIFGGCAGLGASWQAPQVELTSIRPQQLGLDRQTLLVGLRIHNPNDRMLPIRAMTYRLWLDGTEVASGGGALERQIPAFGEAQAEVSVLADAAALLPRLPSLALQPGPIGYRIVGTATLAGVIPIPFEHSGQIDPGALLRQALF